MNILKNILKDCSIRYQCCMLIFSEQGMQQNYIISTIIENSRIYKKISKIWEKIILNDDSTIIDSENNHDRIYSLYANSCT